jgi:hypothetical protein
MASLITAAGGADFKASSMPGIDEISAEEAAE